MVKRNKQNYIRSQYKMVHAIFIILTIKVNQSMHQTVSNHLRDSCYSCQRYISVCGVIHHIDILTGQSASIHSFAAIYLSC